MTWIDDEFLDEDAVIAERGLRLRASAGKAFRDFFAGMGDPHALAAAAGGSLDHHRIADLVGDLSRALGRFDHAEMAGDGRHLGRVGEFLRFDLVAHRLNGFGIGTNENDVRLGQGMREGRTFREKTIARMDSLGPCLETGGDDLVDREIGLGRGGRAYRNGLIRHLDMQRILVRFGIDGDGPDAHAARRLNDATGDLAAVSDQDCLEHRALARKAPAFLQRSFLLKRPKRVNNPRRLAFGRRGGRPASFRSRLQPLARRSSPARG